MKPEIREVSPRQVLAEVAAAIPSDVHPNIVIIGSLAAAYGLFRGANGLLSRRNITAAQLDDIGRRLLAFAIKPLEQSENKEV